MLWFSLFALATRSLKPITLVIPAMKQTSNSSTKLPAEQTDYWKHQEKAFLDKVRASGRTVAVTEPSDTTKFVATFPQGKTPKTRSKEFDELQ